MSRHWIWLTSALIVLLAGGLLTKRLPMPMPKPDRDTRPDIIQVFPMGPYQHLAQPWMEPRTNAPLLTPAFQKEKTLAFQTRHLAPWKRDFLKAFLPKGALEREAQALTNIREDLKGGQGFGSNYRPYDLAWLERLETRVPPPLRRPLAYRAADRAVMLDNAPLRLLPTMDPYLQSHSTPGEGYPFDNLQVSALWAGTPVYILQETPDGAWSKVLAPDCYGWVRSQTLARAGGDFVAQWQRTIALKGLAVVVKTETPVTDAHGVFRFQAYVGAVYPRCKSGGQGLGILIPGRDRATGQAFSLRARLPEGSGVRQPWACTPRHASLLWKTLLGRPYGWGNLDFNNDCSSELKAFFAPFGLWLPRHSTDQKNAGHPMDLSALGMAERIDRLRALGHPYRTLVWFEGHIMLYLGPVDYRAANGQTAKGFMTYQDLWGLRPRSQLPDYRKIVGASVLFPVLDRYPESPELDSLANKKAFVLTNLDEQ